MVLELVSWWYSDGWLETAKRALGWLSKVSRAFSLPVLIRTLFSPWKQIISAPGDNLSDRLKAISDNLISRCVGFSVRCLSLLAFLVISLVTAIAAVLYIIIWPLMPVALLYFLYRSIRG